MQDFLVETVSLWNETLCLRLTVVSDYTFSSIENVLINCSSKHGSLQQKIANNWKQKTVLTVIITVKSCLNK